MPPSHVSYGLLSIKALVVGVNTVSKHCVSLIHITVVDCGINSLPMPDQDHFTFCTCDRRIQKVSPQHDVVLLQNRNDHCWILATLGFVDAHGIGEINVLQLILGILNLSIRI